LRTPRQVPKLDNVQLQNYLQFLRSDVQSITDTASTIKFELRNMLAKDVNEIDMPNASVKGAILIQSQIRCNWYNVTLQSTGKLRLDTEFEGNTQSDITLLLIGV